MTQHVPLHPHFNPDPRHVLECSECKNSSDSSPCTDTDWSTRTSTADTVREWCWWSVELEVDTAVEGVPMIGVSSAECRLQLPASHS